MTVCQFVFKRFFRKKSNSIFLLVLPIGAIFLPMGEWPPIPLGFHYYGIIIMFIASRLSAIIMEDRANKTLLRLSVAPITHFQYLLQNLLAYTVILTAVNLVFIILGVIVHGESVPSPSLLFIIYTVYSITSLGFSLAWYATFRNKEAAFSILGGIIILMAMLGGVLWPVEIMPESLQRAVMLLPTYWIAEATVLLSYEAPTEELAIPLVVMFLFCIAFLLLGSRRRLT
ncbi:multidrug ABC transporter permease [Anaerobacillus alkalidiazotrophicus]|uniref:Multidrug ABC transporter permease n=1 Tax=Anaerobacillus alkalidiazotrophicus TaxID=472963 RepID=A0A1S2M5X4_9BACI|nr:ABC transporter permease [Anaerobacillus alkalidiazotrophicus]OIJ20158.1 multidrug ABC transporter permease [Anaerobacillus alkalidiazotrophicus]